MCTQEADYTSTYTEFCVKKPLWNESGISGYQNQSAQVLGEMMTEFDQPIFIPVLSEMFSKMLVISAELNFECSKPNYNSKKKNGPQFSRQLSEAYSEHKRICKEWRAVGRPTEKTNPMKIRKLESQRRLQRLSREEQSFKAIQNHEELMETHQKNISQVCSKLKKTAR